MNEIAAIVLAAGQSKRMGAPKLLLPWGKTTVLGQVLITLQEAGLTRILVVVGAYQEQVRAEALAHGASTVFNPDYAEGEMLSSLQVGLRSLAPETRAALICLGDQPQIRSETIRLLCRAFQNSGSLLVIPTYQHRRGHPWLIARPLWQEALALTRETTPRHLLEKYSDQIQYVLADASVLQDLDTPEDYHLSHP
ncbi:MAG: nucleotidyltransferase family protein [Anaerolineales bacterium]|nr:nucleotidyltransferase family protein [Anaerolineales bacterium]MCX7609432.1 nucleotidyltransferase family protein [Anaerolineales bacterium]MDW8227448.1 nucleotidyltransferase family protein [Anaerolineales bacterium]